MSPTTPFSTLARALALGARPGELLSELHRELLAATGGIRSVVLEAAAESGSYVASSGRGFNGGGGEGLASLGAIWLDDGEASRFAERAAGGPGLIDLAGFPTLARQLGAASALIAPVSFTRRPTVVLVARPDVPEETAIEAASRASIEFGIALEWLRLSREGSFHHRLRELSLMFSRGITSSAGLLPALETVTPRSEPAARHRPHVGVAPRPARARSPPGRVLRSVLRGNRRAGERRRHERAGVRPAPRSSATHPRERPSARRAAARLAPRARHARRGRRAWRASIASSSST